MNIRQGKCGDAEPTCASSSTRSSYFAPSAQKQEAADLFRDHREAKNQSCGICLGLPSERGILEHIKGLPLCKHVFCFQCILQWAKIGENKCPLCKRVFKFVRRKRTYAGIVGETVKVDDKVQAAESGSSSLVLGLQNEHWDQEGAGHRGYDEDNFVVGDDVIIYDMTEDELDKSEKMIRLAVRARKQQKRREKRKRDNKRKHTRTRKTEKNNINKQSDDRKVNFRHDMKGKRRRSRVIESSSSSDECADDDDKADAEASASSSHLFQTAGVAFDDCIFESFRFRGRDGIRDGGKSANK